VIVCAFDGFPGGRWHNVKLYCLFAGDGFAFPVPLSKLPKLRIGAAVELPPIAAIAMRTAVQSVTARLRRMASGLNRGLGRSEKATLCTKSREGLGR